MSESQSLTSLQGLTFDDVYILPGKTDVTPDAVSIESEILKGVVTSMPIWASPMQTVWSVSLARAMARRGALAPISVHLSENGLAEMGAHAKALRFKNSTTPAIATVSQSAFERLVPLLDSGELDFLILEAVQPYSTAMLKIVEKWSPKFPGKIVVGNLATAEAAEEFCQFPLAALKVGLGPGSICTTRVVLGIGVPQLDAIQSVSQVAARRGIPVIADGGIKHLGDIAKALAAGASSVMMGRLFAATEEAAGESIQLNGSPYKRYCGSEYPSVEIPLDSGSRKGVRVEGLSGYVACTGPVEDLLTQIEKALRCSFAFVGAADIKSFRERARLIRVSPSAFQEGLGHSITVITESNRTFNDHLLAPSHQLQFDNVFETGMPA